MKVPLLDLKAQYASIKEEVKLAIDEVLESQYFILGPEVEELEKNIAAYSKVAYAVGISSGSDALLISLMAIGIRPGDEIITTPFTFFSTAGVISRLHAVPVFVDIDPVTFNLDPRKLAAAITEKTKAIIPVHLFGQCADMDAVIAVAKQKEVFIVEDAAQSIGADYKGGKAGSMGDMGIFSFFPTKNLGGYGDGGMVVTDDKSFYEKIKILRVHGAHSRYYHKLLGGNFRLDAIQAAVLNVKLKYLDQWSQERRQNAAYYTQKFTDLGLMERGFIRVPVPVYAYTGDKNYHIFNQYTLRVQNRDELREYLKQNGIGAEIYYPLPLHLQACFQELGYSEGDFPISEDAAEAVISIPIYPELTTEQQDYIIQKIAQFYIKAKGDGI